jgi:diguanylate cyclase (GGDEF)-like protein
VLSLGTVLFYTFGHLLEITATGASGSLTGVKIMYVGSCYMAPLFLLFVMDYCKVSMSRIKYFWVRVPILGIPLVNLVLAWTMDRHNLIYKTYYFDTAHPLLGLQIIAGPLYMMVQIISIVCVAMVCCILVNRMLTWHKNYRKTLWVMMLSALAPVVANLLYVLGSVVFTTANPDAYQLNFTPYTLVIVSILYYLCVMRYGLFDFVPIAYSVALDSIKDAFVIVDADMNCVDSNRAAKRIFENIETYRKGMPVTLIENWPDELRDLFNSIDGEPIHFKLKNDVERSFSASVSGITAERKRLLGWIVLIQDVTASERLLLQLEEAASTDMLTGIYNRRYFLEIAEMEFEKSKRKKSPCYAMIFDLDFFKKVNDTYGHLAGDEVLRTVAKRVSDTVRSYDLLARYGGEEFVILLDVGSGTTDDIALILAERIRTAVAANPCVYEGVEIPVTLSIGVASNEGVDTLEDLLKEADRAMYHAKETGRNRVVMIGRDVE